MKQFLLLAYISVFFIPFTLLAQETDSTQLVPSENQYGFMENKREFVYQEKDSVFTSIGFFVYQDGEYIFDITIDNRSDDTLFFDPADIHLFRYQCDTLAENLVYHPIDEEMVLDSIDESIDHKTKKIRNKNILSILFGLACITAEVAGASGDMDYALVDVIHVVNDAAQIGLDISRQSNADAIYNLEFAGDYWLNGVIHQERILPDTFLSGKIHFRVDPSEEMKIDIPLDQRIFRFGFQQAPMSKKI